MLPDPRMARRVRLDLKSKSLAPFNYVRIEELKWAPCHLYPYIAPVDDYAVEVRCKYGN